MTFAKQNSPVSGRPEFSSHIQKKLSRVNWRVWGVRLLGLICVFEVAGLLLFGLWPFDSPLNQVTWLADGGGLRFGRHGTALSVGTINAEQPPLRDPCSLEIWFEPGSAHGGGALFSLYSKPTRRDLSLLQNHSDLILRIETKIGPYRPQISELDFTEVLRPRTPTFVTVTSSGKNLSTYIDGALAQPESLFPLSEKDFEGVLIVGDTPIDNHNWSGTVRGLAIYNVELMPAQVVHHFQTWTKTGRPGIAEGEHAIAVYLFNEEKGSIIHNHVPAGPDLIIPKHYVVLDQVFLQSFLDAYEPEWGYWQDVLINIGGFMPFGFLICAYLSLARRTKHPGLVTIVLGFALSLAIESTQSVLPTRNSDTTDVITDTLGTALGVAVYSMNFWRAPLERIWAHLQGNLK